jgi:hypothetical protein
MIAFLLLTLPIFGVVAVGWIAVRVKLRPAGLVDSVGWLSA